MSRRRSFTIRVVLLFHLVCAVGFGFARYSAKCFITDYERERRALKGFPDVREARTRRVIPYWLNKCRLVPPSHYERVVYLDLSECSLTASDVADLESFKYLEVLFLDGNRVGDAVGPAIGKLKHLQRLSLDATGVTDRSMSYVGGLQHLHALSISQNEVSDKGVAELRLPMLDGFGAACTGITDRGLKQLALSSPELESVSVGYTAVTDEGVMFLCESCSIALLDIRGARVSGSTAMDLERRFPELTVR